MSAKNCTVFNPVPAAIHAAAVTIHVAAATLIRTVVKLVLATTPPLSTPTPFLSRTTHSLRLPCVSNIPPPACPASHVPPKRHTFSPTEPVCLH
ncbi:hypothetical protein K438DRAFT_1834253 [Mycena galopus ATCC 62051]|nr:hypothetical protein K438DRAFT_1834253 [Mycena galopus ATCC 62051]